MLEISTNYTEPVCPITIFESRILFQQKLEQLAPPLPFKNGSNRYKCVIINNIKQLSYLK